MLSMKSGLHGGAEGTEAQGVVMRHLLAAIGSASQSLFSIAIPPTILLGIGVLLIVSGCSIVGPPIGDGQLLYRACFNPLGSPASAPPNSPGDVRQENSPARVERESALLQVRFDGDKPGPAALPLAQTGVGKRDQQNEGKRPETQPNTLPPPRATEPSGLTLDQVINATLIADPKLRAGLEFINQANADALTSSLLPNPILNSDVQLLPLTRLFTVTDQGGPPQTDHAVGYPIDWFLFGKRAAAMASAVAGVRVSEADYADLVRQRVRDAAVAFYDVLEAKGLLDLARNDLENLQKVEAATRRAVEAGGRPTVELNRVRLDVLRSQQTVREAESTLTIARARLRAMFGRQDADPNFEVAGKLDTALIHEPMPVEEAFAIARQNRPDIMSLRLQVEKASKDIRVETTKGCPMVLPQFGYTRQFQEKAIGFPDASSWSAAVSISLPFFDRNQGNIAKANSVMAQNSFNLDAGQVDLRAEIVQAVSELETAYKNAGAVAEEQLRLASEVRDSFQKAYQVGGRTLLEVLDAERNYRETYRAYISNRANYWRAWFRFSAAIGKQVQSHDEPAR